MSTRFRKQGHEEEAPTPSRTCLCLALEYSKGFPVQGLQSQQQIQEKPACIRRTCRPPRKVSATHVDHSRHNTARQFFRSRAILAGKVERNDEGTGLENHVPPP